MTGLHDGNLAPGRNGWGSNIAPVFATISGDVDQSIVGAHPDQVDIQWRRRDGINDTPAGHRFHIRCGVHPYTGRDFGVSFPRQIRTDDFPGVATILGFEQHVARVEQSLRVKRGKQNGGSTNKTVLATAHCFGRDVLGLARTFVKLGHFAPINDVGVEWIWRHVAIFFHAHWVPFTESNAAIVAAGGNAYRTTFLLATVHIVGKSIVGAHMVKLRRRLVVPGAECLPAVHGDDGSLIAGQQDDVGVIGIDPDAVVVVAAGSAAEGRPGFATIH